MLVMLGLLITGFAFAHWSEVLYINGTIGTGELDWEWTEVGHLDPGPPPGIIVPDYNCRDNFAEPTPRYWMNPEYKDVGYTTAVITDPHNITLTLHNVYPSYFNMITLYAHVIGSIPLIIEEVNFKSAYEEVTITEVNDVVKLDLNGDDNDDIEFMWKDDIFGLQLHPCEELDETSFWLHILQDAPENDTLEFTIEIVAIQWNCYNGD
jgi:hypothetical protein